jgi:hypothetical protein
VPSSENLFSSLSYAIFVAPAAVVLTWMAWRIMVLCLFYTFSGATWIGGRPATFRVPLLIGLVPVTLPMLAMAFPAWILMRVFPGLALEPGEVPRLFVRTKSYALSAIFVFCLVLPLVCVPLRYLADRVEGPKIGVWHWVLLLGPLTALIIWFARFLRR